MQSKSAILLLSDGKKFEGNQLGYLGETVGEVCFNTGMTGYQEILTDPSYCSQIVTMTSPHIGNYGITEEDDESSKIQVSGFVVKEETITPSNWRSTSSLNEYLNKNKIVGIQNIDTRSLVKCIRSEGTMNGIISNDILNKIKLQEIISAHPKMEGKDLVKDVTTRNIYKLNENKNYKKIVVIDLGIKKNILKLL